MVRPFPGGADLLGKRTAIRNNMIPRHPQGYRSNTMQEKLFNRLMDVIEYDVAPLTRKRVAIGCKVFGAAVLRKDDLSLVLAETNMEAFSPLWHAHGRTCSSGAAWKSPFIKRSCVCAAMGCRAMGTTCFWK